MRQNTSLKRPSIFCTEKNCWIQVVIIFGIPMKGERVGEWVFVVDLKVHPLNQRIISDYQGYFQKWEPISSDFSLWFLQSIFSGTPKKHWVFIPK